MPIPENRRSIERALAEQRRKRLPGMDAKQRKLAQIDAHLAKMRDTIEFRSPFGPLGRLVDAVVMRRHLIA